MNVKNTIGLLLLLVFGQVAAQTSTIFKTVNNGTNVYLDSIKKTFVKHKAAAKADSLWLAELANVDMYQDIADEIKTANSDEKVDYDLSTDLLKERLAAMDAKSPFNIVYDPSVENLIKSFLKNRKRSFERLMAVSDYYFPLLEEALAKQNIPLEIKYLAIVESALNPKAVSRMGATGLWQFMYQTGKQYGLNIDSYIDERCDPLKASAAAAQYMSNMYKIFGDWDLVLASYNSGPGNVTKAIRRSSGQQNYWNIRKNLPKETQGYVPAFLATMYLYEYHKEHGLVPQKALVKHFATDTIRVKKQMSFNQIASLLDVSVPQLQLLNPSYKLNVVPFYQDKEHFIRLPKDKIAIFASNEDKIYAYIDYENELREKPIHLTKNLIVKDSAVVQSAVVQTKGSLYRVQRGDNLGSIAAKYNVTVAQLKQWNKLKGTGIVPGKSLRVEGPVYEKEDLITKKVAHLQHAVVSNTGNKNNKENTSAEDNSEPTHLVQKGDNLGNIAKKYNVTVAELQNWNGLNNENVQLGAVLKVAKELPETAKHDVAQAVERRDVEYVVQKGDNLASVAAKFGTAVSDLKQWNKLKDNTIVAGKNLIVAKDEVALISDKATVSSFKSKSSKAASKKSNSDYYVKKGDSLFSIAKKYPGVTASDLKKWNGISGEDLKPGMKLKING